ncbi:MAG: DNA recombination protein RmuC [Candidatus Limimorpha sp.]
MNVLYLVIGILIGIAIGFYIGYVRRQSLVVKVDLLQKQIASLDKQYSESLDTQRQRFDETLAKVEAQMRLATDDMLKQRQKELAETNSSCLGNIVNPLKETLDKMKKAIDDNTLKQMSLSSAMKANIDNMIKQSEAARMSAEELSRVFKHGAKVQGDWGETILDELLESQGLIQGVHYDTQCVIRDEKGNVVKSDDGSTMRPDVILHLDQQREVIIDAKVSLTSYIDYVNAENESEREKHLKGHIDSLTKHVKELSQKDYTSYIAPPKIKMNYVIMFVPNTGALWTALKAQPDLWRKAMDKDVFIADEQTLYAALKIINLTWKQIAQAQNHKQLYDLANEIVERVGMFYKHYSALGKAIDTAHSAYEEGEKKLVNGKQSIIKSCNKLIDLGAKQSAKNRLPKNDEADEATYIEEKISNNNNT